ncbi:MAG TPA: hypothetical protein VGB18_09470 [Candidatus Thermoplasmatota archaeon]
MRAIGAVALAVIVLLAGCSGKSRPDDTVEPTASERTSQLPSTEARIPGEKPWIEAGGVRYRSYNASGHVTAHAIHVGTMSPLDSGPPRIDFNVNDTVSAIIAEVRWTGDHSNFDLRVTTPKWCPDASIIGPCYSDYWRTGEGPGTIRVARNNGELGPWALRLEVDRAMIESEGNGEWTALAWSNVAVQADLQLFVTLFSGGAPPPDFTALEN